MRERDAAFGRSSTCPFPVLPVPELRQLAAVGRIL